MNVSLRRHLTAVFASALLLVLIACTVTGLSGPNIVALGDTATYDIAFDNTSGFTDVAGYVYFDVPAGWTVTAATYDATVNGIPYANVPATQIDPSEGPCGMTPGPAAGYQRLAFQSATFPQTTVDDSGTLHVTFSIAGGAGNFVLSAFGGGGPTCSSNAPQTLPVTVNGTLAAPRPSKTFTPDLIETGGVSTLAIDLQNLNTASLSDIGFTDAYPAGLVNAPTPNATSTCGGSIIAPAGGTSLAFSGGTLANLASCRITIDVTAAATGIYDNVLEAGGISTGEATSPSVASNTATLTAVGPGQLPPTVEKFFLPEEIFLGESSTLTITLHNPNSVPLTGAGVIDVYPTDVVNAATPNAATTCAGGSVTAAAGGPSVELTNGTIPANGSCTVTVDVTALLDDIYENVIPAGAVTSSNGVPNTAPSDPAYLRVDPLGAVLTKAFAPDAIAVGGTSRLTITITTDADLPFPNFDDIYPAGLVNAATPNIATTCGVDADLTANPGEGSLSFWIPSIAAGTTCSVSVDVTSSTAGSYENVIPAGDLRTDGGPTNALPSNTATLAVLIDAPTVAKAFTPATIIAGGTSTLTITLTNPNADPILDVELTDAYPAGLVNAAAPNASSTCGSPSITATAGGDALEILGGTIPASGSCTVTVDVTALTPGTYSNEVPAGWVVSSNAFPNAAPSNTATLEVTAVPLVAPTVSKAFAPASIVEDAVSTLTITLTNSNADAITGAAFTDAYPAGLVNAATPNAATTCGGVVTAAAGASSLAISGATIPASGSCTVSVDVTAATAGTYPNDIPAGAVTSDNAPSNAVASNTATLEVTAAPLAAPTVAKTFAPPSFVLGETTRLTVTLENANASDITGVAFTDTYPAGLVNADPANAATTCGGTVLASAGAASLSLTGGTIPAGGTCTVSVDVAATTVGSFVNEIDAGAVTSSNAPANTTGAASAPLTVTAAPAAVAGVPTLGEWGLILLAAALGLLALRAIRV